MPPSPDDLQQLTQVGFWTTVSGSLTAALGSLGWFMFREQNRRIKVLEQARIELGAKMATKKDIELLYEKVNHNHEVTLERIIQIIREGH